MHEPFTKPQPPRSAFRSNTFGYSKLGPRRLGALTQPASAFPLRKSVVYGAFVGARGAPDGRRRRSSARAVVHNRSHARWQQIMTDPTYFGPDQYGEVIDDTVRAVQGRFSGIIAFLWKLIL